MSWLLGTILFFLGASLLFYVLFAGADFGAGILEIFLGREERGEQRRLISHAMAPVWEANHVWLILAVVILFMGFPEVYSLTTTYLHIPLIAILVGIVARGCAFTFRYYDAPTTGLYGVYSWVFAISSMWTSFFLGVVSGAVMLGRINPAAPDFYTLYIAPWWNLFCVSLGLFTVCLFTFLAAAYLVGETQNPNLRRLFIRRARIANIAVVISGALVFPAAEYVGISLQKDFFENRLSLLCFGTATVLLVPFWLNIKPNWAPLMMRVLGGAIVSLVLFGWYAVQFPLALRFQGPIGAGGLTFFDAAAPEATQRALLGALIVGSFIIFPALAYLMKIFKWRTIEQSDRT